MKRFIPLLVVAALFIAYLLAFPGSAPRAYGALWDQVSTMLIVIPPIFLLLGLLDAWVPRETMIRFLGEKSGLAGKAIAFALGSAAAGPLYGAFPVAGLLMKKGASFDNILVFIGAWSTTKIPMFLFEVRSLGFRFALARLFIDLVIIVIMAMLIKRFVGAEEIANLYRKAADRA